jgi:hypothetical protein
MANTERNYIGKCFFQHLVAVMEDVANAGETTSVNPNGERIRTPHRQMPKGMDAECFLILVATTEMQRRMPNGTTASTLGVA